MRTLKQLLDDPNLTIEQVEALVFEQQVYEELDIMYSHEQWDAMSADEKTEAYNKVHAMVTEELAQEQAEFERGFNDAHALSEMDLTDL